MAFDIYALDKLEDYDEENTEAYQEALHQLFAESPEAEAHRELDPEMGFWSYQSIYYAQAYIGVTLPQMDKANMEELLLDIFPRKISISSPDEMETAVPEISAFWRYLQRVYKLRNAGKILAFLDQVQPQFIRAMQDPSKFGMAKSFFMQGHAAGFDMTDKTEVNKFMLLHNMAMMQGNVEALPPVSPDIAAMMNLLDEGKRPSTQPSTHKRSKARDARKKKKKQRRR